MKKHVLGTLENITGALLFLLVLRTWTHLIINISDLLKSDALMLFPIMIALAYTLVLSYGFIEDGIRDLKKWRRKNE